MKAFQRAGAVFFSLFTFFLFSLSAAAFVEGGYIEWDGISPFQKNNKYIISHEITINKDFDIPALTQLVINDGALLVISDGAELHIKGSLILKTGGTFQNDGTVKLYSSGTLTIFGNVNQNGTLTGSPESAINLSGSFAAGNESTTVVEGNLTLMSKAVLNLNGAFLLSGSMSVGCYSAAYFNSDSITLGKTSYIYISGKLTLFGSSELTLLGRLVVSSGGELFAFGAETVSGSVLINANAKVLLRGELGLNEESDMTVLGDVYLFTDSNISQYGRLTIKKGGHIRGDGVLKAGMLDKIVRNGELSVALECIETEKDEITSFGGLILVNKEYSIPSDYAPDINPKAYAAYLDMYSAAKEAGFESMCINSGYRSYGYQDYVFNRWCSIYGEAVASTLSSRPGHSEHQTGLAFDISSILTVYGDSEEGKWLAKNCVNYGFIIRYPSDKTEITKYIYEPWHIRYVGVNAAKLIDESDLCLEEFFGVA